MFSRIKHLRDSGGAPGAVSSQSMSTPKFTVADIRQTFLDFFKDKGHAVVASSPLVPGNDPTLMFTNSGMVQFKDVFLGTDKRPYVRAASVQACLRAGGKHNDLENVGYTARHHTFFEMLGNWSFGDYFKAEAIAWAWELVTAAGFDGDRIWATVHTSDDEAEAIWHEQIGLPIERIQRLGDDNFWEMGETGPCGPDSELHYDCGPEWGAPGGPAHGDGDRYIEFWNLVFMSDFRHADGSLTALPARNVDTGGGLERWLMLLQGVRSAFDTDVFRPMLESAQSATGRTLGTDPETDVALRVVADHARTMTFLVADGVVPSNEDRGYVLRRLIRRAVRFTYLLGVHHAVLADLVGACVEEMAQAYPELNAEADRILGVVEREEGAFRTTLARGVSLLDESVAANPATVPGDVVFRLHDTYGFPVEVTQEMASERGIEVDFAGFEALMADQRKRARAATRKDDVYADLATFHDVLAGSGPTEFVGREEYETKARVIAVVDNSVFLDRSPFYAESGGQVGDTGWITTDTGRAEVLDTTFALPGLHRHHIASIEGTIEAGQEAVASIDGDRRDAIRRNHTATHVLHWALRQVLGDHVAQQGSLVDPDRLRFDFSHFDALTDEQVAAVEDIANREILDNAPVRHYETTKAHAVELGAIAFFGEKYGDVVRVLEAGRHSLELCGGTHVKALGDIGPAKIISEGSIGSNIRRLEAVTGTGTIDRLRARERELAAAAAAVGVPTEDLAEGITKRLAELKAVRDEVTSLRRQVAAHSAGSLVESAVNGAVVARVESDERTAVREMAVSLRDRPGIRAVVLGSSPGGKGVVLVAAVSPESGLNAGELIAEATRMVGGGGAKGADLATAGGRDAGQLDAALDHVRTLL